MVGDCRAFALVPVAGLAPARVLLGLDNMEIEAFTETRIVGVIAGPYVYPIGPHVGYPGMLVALACMLQSGLGRVCQVVAVKHFFDGGGPFEVDSGNGHCAVPLGGLFGVVDDFVSPLLYVIEGARDGVEVFAERFACCGVAEAHESMVDVEVGV